MASTAGSYPWQWLRQVNMGLLDSPLAKQPAVSRGAPLGVTGLSLEEGDEWLKAAFYLGQVL